MRRASDLLAGCDQIVICAPDAHGRLLGKRRPAADWDRLRLEGMAMPDFHLICGIDGRPQPGFAVAGAHLGFRNGWLRPDPAAAFLVPGDGRTVHVLAHVHAANGEPVAVAPRAILAAQLARLEAHGIAARAASELEFYALRQSYAEAWAAGYAGLAPLYHRHGDNDVLVTQLAAPLCRAIEAACENAGIAVDQVQGEGGAGQFEINIRPAAPLEAADDHVVFKHIAKLCGHAAGHATTFMAKPFENDAGSGGHIHLSLATRDGRNALGEGRDLAAFGAAFVAGLVCHLPELTLLAAPHINSYKRLVPHAFTPLRSSWGWDNRTALVRLLDGRGGPRIEVRLPGADVNPYHALAAIIAAGLAGVAGALPLPPSKAGAEDRPEDPAIPRDLSEAMAAFAASDLARTAFGEAAHAHLLTHARHEWEAGRRAVTDWELRRGFEVA